MHSHTYALRTIVITDSVSKGSWKNTCISTIPETVQKIVQSIDLDSIHVVQNKTHAWVPMANKSTPYEAASANMQT